MIYSRGRIFAIVGLGERIFLKAKATFADQLAAEGAEQFAYSRSGKLAKMGYWTLPDQALDDPELACGWARRALEASDPDFPDAAPLLAGGEFVGR